MQFTFLPAEFSDSGFGENFCDVIDALILDIDSEIFRCLEQFGNILHPVAGLGIFHRGFQGIRHISAVIGMRRRSRSDHPGEITRRYHFR